MAESTTRLEQSVVEGPRTSRSRARRTLVAFSILAITTTAGGGLALIEGALRVYLHIQHGVQGKSYGLWRYDKALGAIHREHAYNTGAETNDYGFRNSEDVLEPRKDGSFRFIAYGGSTTFCYNLGNDEAWPLQLQRILREEHHPADQVLNGGAILWSIGHALARARNDLPALRPDFVLIYSGINEEGNARALAAAGESMPDLVRRAKFGRFAINLDQNRWGKRNLAIVRLFDYRVKPWLARFRQQQVGAETHGNPDPAVLHNYLHVLRQFISLIRKNGGTPIFVVQASSGVNPMGVHVTGYSRWGARVARQLDVAVIDAANTVTTYEGDPRQLFSESGVHYTAIGARRLAEFLYQTLVLADHRHAGTS